MSHTMCLCLDLSFPCVVWLDPHDSMLVYMFICLSYMLLCSMPCFPILCSSFCSMLMLGLLAHMHVWCCWLCLAWIYVFTCIFPCYMVRSLSSHAYMLGFMFFHVYVLGLYLLMCMFLCLCLDLCFHMPMCLDLCSLQALYYLPCACVLHAMFVCLDLGYVCHAMCYCSPFVAFVYFSYVLAIW